MVNEIRKELLSSIPSEDIEPLNFQKKSRPIRYIHAVLLLIPSGSDAVIASETSSCALNLL